MDYLHKLNPLGGQFIGGINKEQMKELTIKGERFFVSYRYVSMILREWRMISHDRDLTNYGHKRRYMSPDSGSQSNIYALISALCHQWTNKNIAELVFNKKFKKVLKGSEMLIGLLLKSLFKMCKKYVKGTIKDFKSLKSKPLAARNRFNTNVIPDDDYQPFQLSHDDDSGYEYSGESLEDVFSSINENAGDWMKLVTSEFGKKISLVCSLLICTPVVNSFGIKPDLFGYYGKFEESLRFDYGKMSNLTFIPLMIEHTSWVGKKMCQFYSATKQYGIEQGINCLYVSSSDHKLFDQEYWWLSRNHKNFSCCSLVTAPDGTPDPFTLGGYLHRCDCAINLVDKILPTIHDVGARHRLERQKFECQHWASECSGVLRSSESRPFPYAVMLCGPPGIGKTTLKDLCFDQMHMTDNASGRFEIKYNPANIYTVNPNDSFWSGFTSEKTGVFLDDVAQKKPDIMAQTDGGDLGELIQIINKAPFLPNQAELEKKGKTPMRIRYVVGTTNTSDLSAMHVYNCADAVYRRMVFIEARVKEPFKLEGSAALGGDATLPYNLDMWNFQIFRYYPSGNPKQVDKRIWNGHKFVSFTNQTETIDSCQLALFLKNDVDRHWAKEEQADGSVKHMMSAKACVHGISSAVCNLGCKYEAESFVSFKKNFWACCLLFPIMSMFSLALPFLKIFPNTDNSIPIWPLRCAKYLINKLPDVEFVPKSIKAYCFIPDHLMNISTKTILDLKYEVWSQRAQMTWKKYYDNEVLKFYLFPSVGVFFSCLYLLKQYTRIHYFGNSLESMPHPDKYENKRENHWVTQQKIGVFPNTGSTISEYTLSTKVRLNTVLLTVIFKDGETYSTNNALILKSNLVVTVSHWCKDNNPPDVCTYRYVQKSGLMNTLTFKVDKTCWWIDRTNDLMYFRFDRINRGCDLTSYLISKSEPVHVNCPGKMFSIDPETFVGCDNHMLRVTNMITLPPYTDCGVPYDARDCYSGRSSFPTGVGFCGSPVIATQGNNKMICGIHCASNKQCASIIRPIYRESVLEAEKRLKIVNISDNQQDMAFVGESLALEITEVHPKCPTKSLSGELIVIGGSKLPRVSPRTRVKRSPIWRDVLDEFRKDGYKRVEHTSPIDCDPKIAIELSMEKAIDNAQFYPAEIEFAVEAMSIEFLKKFTPDMLKRLHPYPMSVAVNGRDGIPYLDRLNLSTSGGYAHPGPKRKLFSLVDPCEEHSECYELTPELEKEVMWIENQYRTGLEANPVFKCSFKDEPITIEKAEKSKIRIFSGSPVAFSVLTRKYLLCIIREFVSHRRLCFEMAIGANAHGMDWDEIYHYVIRHGEDRCFAGDYKNFDKQMSPEIILGAFDVIINLLKAAGWHDDDLEIVRGIACDTSHPTMELFGTLIQCFGSNPSGHVLTTPINSLVNSLYIRIACRRVLEEHGFVCTIGTGGVDFTDFGSIVSLVTYGDDNCGSISDQYPCLNHTTIQQALADVGIIYTTDDKKSKSVGLTHISTITFLKRHFVYDDNLCRVVGPLIEDSLFKALTVWTYSKSISVQEQLASLLESVNREYFFFGRQFFDRRHIFLCDLVKKNNVEIYLSQGKLLSWDEIYMSLKL